MSYTPGTVVYAKLKGYPWWPARVEVEASLPSTVISKKPKTPKPTIGVRFFGSKDYGWFGSNDIKPFDKKDAELTLQKMKNKKHDKLLERSIREALDPSSSSFDDPVDEEGADDDVESESDVELEDESKKSSESYENEDEDEGEYTKKSKSRNKGNKKNRKTTSSKSSEHRRTSSLSQKKKFRTYSSEDEDDVDHSGKGGKKRRASEGSALEKTSKRKHRKIDYTDDEEEKMDLDDVKKIIKKEGSKSPVKSDNESPEGDVNDKDENKYNKDDGASFENKSSRMESESHHRSSKSRQSRTPSDRLLHLRHRLQRMTLKDDIEILDTEKIDEVFTEVENFRITIPLLKESKIGKLMRKIAEKNIDPDPKRIIERSNELIRKWKCLLETPTHEGSDGETSPKTVTQIESESPNREAVHNEESSQPLPGEQEKTDCKNDNVDNNNVKEDKERIPSIMDVDEINDIQPEIGEEKQIIERDNIVTNGSSLNKQEVNSHEKEDFNNKTSEL
ncbi:zinc finger CW-type PWWP domain protein 1 isoform X3 [Rhizophagus clarus]|uniref:Zinc finger CW-type PWWP domain protein 1 isoform X3 n=1 Tax=Rhizophagus clarus TaxID=94130 RepID=A0A8H3R3F0_9GLOM|nr:zinc finger CW-type PWWP domain protein 1 isoform X3 [Rhizophagus clarus]